MTASDIAAWWGAALATVVFLWDIYKWATSGPRLVVRAFPNMVSAGSYWEAQGQLSIFVEAINRGDKLTTLTNIAVFAYRSRLHRLFRKKAHTLLPPNPGIPHELDPGKRWTAMLEQDALRERAPGCVFHLHIGHSGSNRPILVAFSLPK